MVGQQVRVRITQADGSVTDRIIDVLFVATQDVVIDGQVALSPGQFFALEAKAYDASAGVVVGEVRRYPDQLVKDRMIARLKDADGKIVTTRFYGKVANSLTSPNGHTLATLTSDDYGKIPTLELTIPLNNLPPANRPKKIKDGMLDQAVPRVYSLSDRGDVIMLDAEFFSDAGPSP